jgi:hypothetical protein
MPRGTTLRNIRIPDDLWDAVLRKAEAEGRNASEVVREYLEKWITRPPRPPVAQPPKPSAPGNAGACPPAQVV